MDAAGDDNPFVQAYQQQAQPQAPAQQTQQTQQTPQPPEGPAPDIPGVTDNPFIMGAWNALKGGGQAIAHGFGQVTTPQQGEGVLGAAGRIGGGLTEMGEGALGAAGSPAAYPMELAKQGISKGSFGAIPPEIAGEALSLAIPEFGGLGLAEAGAAAAARRAAAPKPGQAPPPGEQPAQQPSAPSAPSAGPTPANDNPFVQAYQGQAEPNPFVQAHQAQAAGDLGAAKTSGEVTKEFTGNLADRLYENQTKQPATDIEMRDRWEAMPEEVRNPEKQQEWYRMGEDERRPADRAFQEHIQPMKDETEKLHEDELFYREKLGVPKDEDPEDEPKLDEPYMHKMVKGQSAGLDALTGNAPDQDPWARRVDSKLPTHADSSYERKHFALIGEDGERIPVRRSDDKKSLDIVGQTTAGKLPKSIAGPSNRVQRLPNATGNIKPGETVLVDGKKMRLGQAKARETTAAGGPEYYENAFIATATDLRQKRKVVNSLKAMYDLKNSPQFEANTRQMRPDGSAPAGTPSNWRRPEFPAFAQKFMHPDIANVIDDFYKRRNVDNDVFDKINNVALQTLFFGNPFIHGMNVAAHWWTARGFDWINPTRYGPLARTMLDAIQQVKTLGPKYRELLNNGSALLAGGTRMRNFDEQMLTAFGETIQKNPDRWTPIVRKLGLNGVGDLIQAISQHSQAALWNIGDVFMMQRVMELEQRGMPLRRAIKETEKHIPNYRLPQKILGSRGLQQMLSNRFIASFSRYHYGMINSFVHMAVDLAGTGKTMAERMEAAGQIVATAALVFFITPALNWGLQQLTGNPKAKVPSRGSGTIPGMIKDWYNGDTSIPQMVGRLLTLAPLPRLGVETVFNRDLFTGRPIAGSANLKGAAALAGHAMKGFGGGAPDIIRQGIEEGPAGLAGGLVKRSLGVQVPTPAQIKKSEDYKKREKSAEKSFNEKSYLHYLFGTDQ